MGKMVRGRQKCVVNARELTEYKRYIPQKRKIRRNMIEAGITIIDRPLIEIIDGWSSRGDLRVPVASSPVCLFAEGASFALATR